MLFQSPNSETVPRERMYRITTMYPEDPRAPFYNPRGGDVPPMARLYLTREKLISRACDEDTLQALLEVDVEDEQTREKRKETCGFSFLCGCWRPDRLIIL